MLLLVGQTNPGEFYLYNYRTSQGEVESCSSEGRNILLKTECQSVVMIQSTQTGYPIPTFRQNFNKSNNVPQTVLGILLQLLSEVNGLEN